MGLNVRLRGGQGKALPGRGRAWYAVGMLQRKETPVWDRRRFVRRQFIQTVDVRSSTRPPLSGRSRDLSLGGIRLTLTQPLSPGEQVNVGLSFPSELRVAFDAEVRNIDHDAPAEAYVAGLRWLSPAEEDVEILRYLLEDSAA